MLFIRQYQPRDQAIIEELHVVGLQQAGAYAGDGPWDDDVRDIPGAYLARRGEFLVGEVGGAVVAMGAVRPLTPTRGEIKRMRVHPPMHGRGYGRQMLLALEDRARALGYRELELETSEQQIAAQQLYRAGGFVEFKRGPWLGFNCIWFEKTLG